VYLEKVKFDTGVKEKKHDKLTDYLAENFRYHFGPNPAFKKSEEGDEDNNRADIGLDSKLWLKETGKKIIENVFITPKAAKKVAAEINSFVIGGLHKDKGRKCVLWECDDTKNKTNNVTQQINAFCVFQQQHISFGKLLEDSSQWSDFERAVSALSSTRIWSDPIAFNVTDLSANGSKEVFDIREWRCRSVRKKEDYFLSLLNDLVKKKEFKSCFAFVFRLWEAEEKPKT